MTATDVILKLKLWQERLTLWSLYSIPSKLIENSDHKSIIHIVLLVYIEHDFYKLKRENKRFSSIDFLHYVGKGFYNDIQVSCYS